MLIAILKYAIVWLALAVLAVALFRGASKAERKNGNH